MPSLIERLITRVLNLRREMWPYKQESLNIVDFDHSVATLAEELGELRGAVRSFLGRPFSPEKTADREHILEECGDVMVPILAILEQCNVSVEEALEEASIKLTLRKTKRDMAIAAGAPVNTSNDQ